MKNLLSPSLVLGLSLLTAGAQSWISQGTVLCDADHDGLATTADVPLRNVLVVVTNASGSYSNVALTGPEGEFLLLLPAHEDFYVEYVEPATLPAGAQVVIPPIGTWNFSLHPGQETLTADFLVQSLECPAPALTCRLNTAGSIRNAKGKALHSFSGQVSSETPLNNSWHHLAHAQKLGFKAGIATSVKCGSTAEGVAYIEFTGTGTLKAIGGKPASAEVMFFARLENREKIEQPDAYYLRVFDPSGRILLLVSADPANPLTVVPVPFSKGSVNLEVIEP